MAIPGLLMALVRRGPRPAPLSFDLCNREFVFKIDYYGRGGGGRPYACTSYRSRPTTVEQRIAHRPEEAARGKLRACDLVKLRLDDVCSEANVRHRAAIVQKKTSRPVQFEITEQSRSSVEAWLPMLRATGSRYLFPSRLHASPHISIRQYARLVHRWVESIGLESAFYGTHSMRRTKAAQIYRKTGNLRAVQLLLGHTKLERARTHFDSLGGLCRWSCFGLDG